MSLHLRAALAVAALFLVAAGEDRGAKDRDPLKERTIYIPYRDLEKVFEKEGRGVFLPYPQFLELWERARATDVETRPPVDAITAAGDYQGTVRGDIAEFQAHYSFEVLREGWTEIPLALGGLALSEAKAEGEGALLRADDKGYRLLVPGRGRYGLTVKFALKVEEKAGYKSIAIRTPKAAVSKLKVTLPGKGLDVTLDPNLAATIREAEGTEVLAFLGASEQIKITWRPKARTLAPDEALISAEAIQRVTVDEGVVQSTATYSLNILRTRVTAFEVEFPAGYKVTALEGEYFPDLSSVREDGKRRVAEVKLHRGVEGEYKFTLSIEKVDPAFPGQGATLEVPRMALRGARTERGVLSLALSPDLRAKVSSATGATQVDVADLGEQAKGAAFGFRYPLHPFTVQLEVEKVQPRVRADSLSIISIDDEQVVLTARYVFQIQRGGLFHLRFILPAGYDLIDATSSLAVRDSRVVDAPEGKVLEVDLEQRTTGGVDVTISLESRRESAEGNISLPFIQALDVIQETGHVGVSLLESLEAVTGEVVGLVPKDPQKIARGGIGWPRDQVLTQGFSYQKHPISADLKVSRKESHVTATVQTSLDVKEDLIKVTSEIHYDVRYAGVDRFRFTLPKGIGETAHIEGALTKEKRSEETDEGTTVVREVTLQRKVLGSYVLTVEYDLKLASAEAGESVTQEIPELTVLDVFSEEGYVAVRKAPNIVLQAEDPTNTNLDSIDPRELPESMRAEGAFLAYQYLRHPVAMNVAVTRYEFKSVLPTLVRSIHTEVVLTTEGALRYEATIALINKHRQFLRVRLPERAEVEALSVDGEDRDYSKDEGEVILVDLADAGKQGKEIRIRLRYNIPRTSPGGLGAARRHRVLLPAIEGEPAPDGLGKPENPPPVAHLSLNLHVPQDRAYIGFSTSMNLLEGPTSFWGGIRKSLLGGNRIDMRGLRVIQAGESLATMVRGGEANSSGDFVPEGKKFSFFKLEGGGAVTITHLSRPLHAAIQLGVIVGLLAAGVNLPRRKIISANLAVFGLAGITITLLAFAPEPMRPYLESALMSAALLGLIWAGLFVVNELKGGTAGPAAPPLATEPHHDPTGGGGPDLEDAAEAKPKRRRTSGRIRKPRRSKGEDE